MKTKRSSLLWFCQALTLAIFLFPFSSNAQNKTLLWKVSGHGLTKPSYLFGTIHLLPKSDTQLPLKFQKIFDSCQQTCLEIDFQHMDQSQMIGIMKRIVFPDNKILQDYLSASEYEKLTKIFKDSFQLDLASVNRIKPIFLLSSALEKAASKDSITVMEFMLTDKNKKQNKEMLGLETADDQLAVLADFPLDKQIQMLKDIISGKEKDYGVNSYKKLYNLYKAQDIEDLYREAVQETGDASVEFNAKLIDQRNKKWIPKIRKIAAQKSTFFAFGAGHLSGKNGVINLLRQAGYHVTPVYP